MVSISRRDRRISLPSFSLRNAALAALTGGLFFVLWQVLADDFSSTSGLLSSAATTSTPLGSSIRGSLVNSIPSAVQECRFFLAESAIPESGLGIFTAIDLEKGDMAQSMPDICIYVADTPKDTALDSHSWARDVFLGSFEGRRPRAACEGVATLVNSMPDGVKAADLISMKMHTNAGLRRDRHPGAGAITHYYGIKSQAVRQVPAGSEITIDYGDWEYDPEEHYEAPIRTPEWLQKHGMCIDHIEIKPSLGEGMGRGAFARRDLPAGTLVAPAPLQAFQHRQDFAQVIPEALFVNYCFQPPGTNMLLFPYGPGVNLINHRGYDANVGLRWSKSPAHRSQWLDLPLRDLWNVMFPGALILEVVALRDIQQGEELYLDYGREWEEAWEEHVRNWRPEDNARNYVYPADMDLSQPFRSLHEQKINPYPMNLATACFEENWDRDPGRQEWTPPKHWPEGLVYCRILKREQKADGSYVYEASLGFDILPHAEDDFQYINTNIPHSAITFVDRPYMSDMHLKNAFRHTIGLPAELVPSAWKGYRA